MKPAIFSLPGCSWGWVNLEELAEICAMTPKRLLKNFFGLSKDVDILAMVIDGGFYNVIIDGEVLQEYMPFVGELLYDEWHSETGNKFHFRLVDKHSGSIFVPAGWTQDVLKARNQGFTGIELVYHTHQNDAERDCPKGALTCAFMGSGFYSAVGVTSPLPSEAEEKKEDEAEEESEIPEELREKAIEQRAKIKLVEEEFGRNCYGAPDNLHFPWDLPLEQFREWINVLSDLDVLVGLKAIDNLETLSQLILPSVKQGKKRGWIACAVYHKVGRMDWASSMGPESDKL